MMYSTWNRNLRFQVFERIKDMPKTNQTTLINTNDQAQIASVEMTQVDIKNLIYVIRNQQVMIDSDLAVLYQVETGRLNEAVNYYKSIIEQN